MSKKNDLPIWIMCTALFMAIFCAVAYYNPSAVKARQAEARYEESMQLAAEMQMAVDQFACINGGECRAPVAR